MKRLDRRLRGYRGPPEAVLYPSAVHPVRRQPSFDRTAAALARRAAIDLTIASLAPGGDGLAHATLRGERRAVFPPRTAPAILEQGYELRSVDAFERFPPTSHVEIVAALERKRS